MVPACIRLKEQASIGQASHLALQATHRSLHLDAHGMGIALAPEEAYLVTPETVETSTRPRFQFGPHHHLQAHCLRRQMQASETQPHNVQCPMALPTHTAIISNTNGDHLYSIPSNVSHTCPDVLGRGDEHLWPAKPIHNFLPSQIVHFPLNLYPSLIFLPRIASFTMYILGVSHLLMWQVRMYENCDVFHLSN